MRILAVKASVQMLKADGFGTGRRKGKVWESYVESMETYGKNIWEKILGKNMGKFWFFYPMVSDVHVCSE